MTDCITRPGGQICPPTSNWQQCRPWDIVQQGKVNCYADALISESLDIAGAHVNVHKLLGVHEQTKLIDLTGNGTAISGGDAQNYPALNAFTTLKHEWRSRQSGHGAITASAYIGYDFGVKKLPSGRERYGIPANVREHITTIRIKQSANPSSRVTSARVERSEDGILWYGVAVVQLSDNDLLNTINFKQSAPSRYWRLRPLTFTGGSCDSWAILAFEMHDYSATKVNNIQDFILLENRDREYQQSAVLLRGYYDLVAVNSELSMFGMGMPTAIYQIKIPFNTCVASLGRPIVIGDIIELPSETQYTTNLKPIKRYLEVNDVSWDTSSYTPGWMPTMLLITAVPALATQETRDIFGDLAAHADESGLFDKDDGNHPMYQDYSTIDQTIRAEANTQVPEKGSEGSNTIREFSEEELAIAAPVAPHLSRVGFNRVGLYVEDALPQNGEDFTRGPEFPLNPKDKDYHRMEYAGLAADVPARLFRYSAIKARWLFLESDKREQFNSQKAGLDEYVVSSTKTPAREIK